VTAGGRSHRAEIVPMARSDCQDRAEQL
jgi:hypothetical protein